MPRQLVTLPSFQGVGAGQTATLDLPVGDLVYHEIRIEYDTSTTGGATQANMETEISKIRLKVNGVTQQEYSAEELFDINALNGKPVNEDGAAGNLSSIPIFLGWPEARSAQGEDSLAWGMSDVSTFQIEIDVANNSSQTPTLSARAVVERGVKRAMGPIRKVKRFTQGVSATGVVTNTGLPRNDDYYAIYAWSSDVDDAVVKVDGAEIWTADRNAAGWLLEDHGWTDVSAVFPIIFNFTRRVADSVKMRDSEGRARKEFRVDFNMSAATAFTFLTETVGLRD